MLAAAVGVRARSVTTASVTSSRALASNTLPFSVPVALMVAIPAPTAVARPVASTVTMLASLLLH
ncbi:hypothetical protein D3C71_2015430 [compost metagenome]